MKFFYVRADFFSVEAQQRLQLERVVKAKDEKHVKDYFNKLFWNILEIKEVENSDHLLIILPE